MLAEFNRHGRRGNGAKPKSRHAMQLQAQPDSTLLINSFNTKTYIAHAEQETCLLGVNLVKTEFNSHPSRRKSFVAREARALNHF